MDYIEYFRNPVKEIPNYALVRLLENEVAGCEIGAANASEERLTQLREEILRRMKQEDA